jgi:hypothetical protein
MHALPVSASNDHRHRRQINQSPESPINADINLGNETMRLEIEMNMTGAHGARMSLTPRAPMVPR